MPQTSQRRQGSAFADSASDAATSSRNWPSLPSSEWTWSPLDEPLTPISNRIAGAMADVLTRQKRES
jgi:hypothetical protein